MDGYENLATRLRNSRWNAVYLAYGQKMHPAARVLTVTAYLSSIHIAFRST